MINKQLGQHLTNKKFITKFCDILPYILANAFCVRKESTLYFDFIVMAITLQVANLKICGKRFIVHEFEYNPLSSFSLYHRSQSSERALLKEYIFDNCNYDVTIPRTISITILYQL